MELVSAVASVIPSAKEEDVLWNMPLSKVLQYEIISLRRLGIVVLNPQPKQQLLSIFDSLGKRE